MNFIILPVHLFRDINLLRSYTKVFLIEEPRYFTDFKFHKLKIAYHRATMKSYEAYLKSKRIDVTYVEYDKIDYSLIQNASLYNPYDHKLLDKFQKLNYTIIDSPNFLLHGDNKEQLNFMNFYKYQRKRLNILMDKDKPVGGSWSYDRDNRDRIPKDQIIPQLPKFRKNKFVTEAISYTKKHFPDNYGSLEYFIYPINFKQADEWYDNFIEHRLEKFGQYEDSIGGDFNYHSVLSPMMNIGLLTDTEVIEKIKKYKYKNLASYEGFVRQIIGWRNYILMMYIQKPVILPQFKTNFEINTDKLWKPIGIDFVDDCILKINEYSYAHHIERLMVLGNFLLLLGTKPELVYKIFMEWCIDSYDWVMVPNVLMMNQFSLLNNKPGMTRPYFSSSGYIYKMGHYKRNELFDCLYYNFIYENQSLLSKNYATAISVKNWNNKSDYDKKKIIETANNFRLILS